MTIEIESREPKRLRSIEPDLKIIVGSGDDVSTQWHHAASLALKSKYVDTMLSTHFLISALALPSGTK